MKIKGLIFVLGIVLLVGVVNAENNAKVEWDVMNLSDDGNVTNYSQINYSSPAYPEIKVSATIDATLWWAEVELNTSEIDFGHVEKGKAYNRSYTMRARGTVDIRVLPKLKEDSSGFFSNLKFSRTTGKTTFKQIGEYTLDFINLSRSDKNWSVIGASDKLVNWGNSSAEKRGTQYMKLDLTNFNGIIPFDQPMNNTIIFQIVPIWSSVEPINNTYSPDEEP